MERQPIGYMLKQITDKIKVSAEVSLKKHNLTLSQTRVIQYIAKHGGTVTQKSIEDYLQVAHPTVVGIVTRMEKNDFLDCHFYENDKRIKIVSLTEKAVQISQVLESEITAQEQLLTKGLSEKDMNHLYHALQTILKNVD